MSTPAEVKARLEAERRGAPFLVYRDGEGAQVIVALDRLLALAWDSEVSRLHAQLEPVGLVDDVLSRNRTYVNGERVQGPKRSPTATGSSSARPR